jgi:3-methyladenine DNA glycosylase AlkD
MHKEEAMRRLAAVGTAQNRKIYARHGIRGEAFGVSYAALGRLAKEIQVDNALALELWRTGNHDARVLATMIADPKAMSSRAVESWARDLDSYVLTDAFARVAVGAPDAKERALRWTRARGEWIASAGWNVVAQLSPASSAFTERELALLLRRIEREIHRAANRARYSMNLALISIALRGGTLLPRALAASRRIGRVEVDHGETGCRTPDAASYIAKTLAYREDREAALAARRRKAQGGARRRARSARR